MLNMIGHCAPNQSVRRLFGRYIKCILLHTMGGEKFFKTLAKLASSSEFSRPQKTTGPIYRSGQWEGTNPHQAGEGVCSCTRQVWIPLAFGELASGYPHLCAYHIWYKPRAVVINCSNWTVTIFHASPLSVILSTNPCLHAVCVCRHCRIDAICTLPLNMYMYKVVKMCKVLIIVCFAVWLTGTFPTFTYYSFRMARYAHNIVKFGDSKLRVWLYMNSYSSCDVSTAIIDVVGSCCGDWDHYFALLF
jgi:hypothetical protein